MDRRVFPMPLCANIKTKSTPFIGWTPLLLAVFFLRRVPLRSLRSFFANELNDLYFEDFGVALMLQPRQEMGKAVASGLFYGS